MRDRLEGPQLEFGGRYLFAAPRDRVWAALNDPEKLKGAIPGCKKLDWTGAHTLDMELKAGIGLLAVTFSGELELSDMVPAEAYTLSGRGRGLLGHAQGAARITLSDASGGTELAFTATGGADNAIMKFGHAILGRSAQKVIDHFFEKFGDTFDTAVTPLPAGD
jgi:carbon monoxide dehydrogenase subunit G